MVLASLVGAIAGSTTASASTLTYDAPAAARRVVDEVVAGERGVAQFARSRQRSASPLSEGRGPTNHRSDRLRHGSIALGVWEVGGLVASASDKLASARLLNRSTTARASANSETYKYGLVGSPLDVNVVLPSVRSTDTQDDGGRTATLKKGALHPRNDAPQLLRVSHTSIATKPGGVPTPAEAADLVKGAKPVGSALKSDAAHRAGSFVVDDIASNGSVFRFVGGDGVTRTLVQTPGELNSVAGRFEWIVDGAGNLTHQMFVKGGSINSVPIKP